MGCRGCLCINRTTSHSSSNYYEPLSTSPSMDSSTTELILISDQSNTPINLSLTLNGLVVVKRKPGPLHSLKLGNPHSTSTRLIPYISLLSLTASHDSSSSTSRLEINALVPSVKGDEKSKMRLWSLRGKVDELTHGGHRDRGGEEEGRCRLDEWVEMGMESAYKDSKPRRRFHVILNPIGGKGLAKKAWESSVKSLLDASGSTYVVSHTGPPGSSSHAYQLGLEHEPGRFDALMSLSGDGIVHELLNGLANQPGRGKKALRETKIVHVPCGSGNALATSIVGPERVGDWMWCTLVGIKGRAIKMDLCSVTQAGGKRLFSFLTQAFGLMADLDLGTEHLRFLGDLRFTLGYIQGSLSRRRYPCKLTVLVDNSSKSLIAQSHNESLLDPSTSTRAQEEEDSDEIPPLKFGYPDEELSEEIRDELRRRKVEVLPRDGELEGGKWWEIDLMTHSDQDRKGKGKEKEKGVFFLYGGKMPFVSKDVMLFPAASPSDGLIDLAIVSPMSPLEALTAMDRAETGKLYNHPSLLYLKTPAYRLSFPRKKDGGGYLSIDGESIEHRDFNVEVHEGLARVMCLGGKLEGSRRIEGY